MTQNTVIPMKGPAKKGEMLEPYQVKMIQNGVSLWAFEPTVKNHGDYVANGIQPHTVDQSIKGK